MDTLVQPAASALDILRNDADPVLSTVGGAESKAAFGRTSLGHDAVVVVECFLNGYEDADLGFGQVGLGRVVPGLGVVVA